MARMTITLSDERHRALKAVSVRSGLTIGQIIEESLELYGVKTEASVESLVDRVREASELYESEALDLAVEETREVRSE